MRMQFKTEVKIAQINKINKLIPKLKDPSPDIRSAAAKELTQFGDIIAKEDFNRIVDIMHNGREEVRRKLYRESHCTWYEYTQARYYAAEILLKMESLYINDQIKTAVIQAKAKSRTKRMGLFASSPP